MVDGPARGLLVSTVKDYYYGEGGVHVSPAFASRKLCDFLTDTEGSYPWNVASLDADFYTLDLPNRALQMKASRAQWPSLVR
jgi:hypothetical protein